MKVLATVLRKYPHTVINRLALYNVKADESSRKYGTRVSVSKRAFKLISSLAGWFWFQFSQFNCVTVSHRRLLSKIIRVSQQLHFKTDVYVIVRVSNFFSLVNNFLL